MKFTLCRPCAQCPFRSDIKGFLTRARVRDIIDSITRHQESFSCHKTIEYEGEDDDEVADIANSEHCAGALIFLERMHKPNQMMRVAERIGLYDRRKLDMKSKVHTAQSMIAAQRR